MKRPINNDSQFTLRLPSDLKARLQKSADEQDIDGVTWVRHAIREKLEREEMKKNGIPDDDLDARIEAVLRKMLAEVKG